MKNPKISKPSSASQTAVRGKYYNRLQQGSNLIILDPALLPFFPDSEAVNRALHAVLAVGDSIQTIAPSRRRPKPVNGSRTPRSAISATATR